jgi:hypothetical protein
MNSAHEMCKVSKQPPLVFYQDDHQSEKPIAIKKKLHKLRNVIRFT